MSMAEGLGMAKGLGTAEARAAACLMAARRDRRRIAALPADLAPADAAAAYAIQAAYVARLLAAQGGRPVGYKIGCTNPTAQAQLGVDEPFHGRLLSPVVRESPARLTAGDFFMRAIETEFAFEMAEDLPAAAAPYDPDGVAAAAGILLSAVEIVDSRYQDWTTIGAPALIADNGCNGAWVRGPASADWRGLALEDHAVTLSCNGAVVREGVGGNVMDHPLNALAWLANTLCMTGGGLERGDLVSTGTCIDIYLAEAGDEFVADFGPLGQVELAFD